MNFLSREGAFTKYRLYRLRFLRLDVIAYDMDEIWPVDVAYVDKLTRYNNGSKYLLVAVDVSSRKLSFTDEVITIIKIATFNPTFYSLVDAKVFRIRTDQRSVKWSNLLFSSSQQAQWSCTKIMVSFRYLLAKPLTLAGDWRVALAEIICPSRIRNVTTKDLFIYTHRKLSKVTH